MRDLGLAVRQIKYENLAFWRNPPAAFFTVAFPLMFLVIFNFAFGNSTIAVDGGTTRYSTFIIPQIVTLEIVSAQYTNIALGLVFARDGGLLKRFRGTPLPAWAYMFGRIVHATLIGVLLTVVTVAAGTLFYGVDVPTDTMPAFVVSLVIAAACFSSLGMAATTIVPNADAAPAIINFSILPLLFLDVFIRIDTAPIWLDVVRNFFPVRHAVRAIEAAFNPFATGSGFEWGHLAVMAAWALAGALIATRFFSWEPRR
jgi:ABC-2 type transport system permease protein